MHRLTTSWEKTLTATRNPLYGAVVPVLGLTWGPTPGHGSPSLTQSQCQRLNLGGWEPASLHPRCPSLAFRAAALVMSLRCAGDREDVPPSAAACILSEVSRESYAGAVDRKRAGSIIMALDPPPTGPAGPT